MAKESAMFNTIVVLMSASLLISVPQQSTDKALLAGGKNVFVERVAGKDLHEEMEKQLTEWGRWKVVSKESDADIIVRMIPSGSNLWGNGERITVSILAASDKRMLWISKKQSGSGVSLHTPHTRLMMKIMNEMKQDSNLWIQ
jgi:hypothetical protein